MARKQNDYTIKTLVVDSYCAHMTFAQALIMAHYIMDNGARVISLERIEKYVDRSGEEAWSIVARRLSDDARLVWYGYDTNRELEAQFNAWLRAQERVQAVG